MDIYGFKNEEGTEIVLEFDNNDSSRKELPSGKWGSKFNIQDILDEGGISYIKPVHHPQFQFADSVIITDDDYTRTIGTIPEADIKAVLYARTNQIKNDFINALVPEDEHKRWMVKGDRLNRKKAKFAAGQGPDLSEQEEALADYLDIEAEQTGMVHDVADTIKDDIENSTGQILIDFDVENHPEWG